MTPLQTHRNPTTSDVMTPVGHLDPIELRVFDDMTVEVALSIMAGAGVDHLLLCDGDDERTGSLYLAHPKFEGFEVRQTVKPGRAA